MTTLTVGNAVQVDVSDLTSSERAVALYASDMPTCADPGSRGELSAWIVQGALRLGTAELRRRGELSNGHFLLALYELLTPQVQARHEVLFPDAFRLEVAEQAAAVSVEADAMSVLALARNAAARVEGDCPCAGTGIVECSDDDLGLSFDLHCPVHAVRRSGPFGDESMPGVAA